MATIDRIKAIRNRTSSSTGSSTLAKIQNIRAQTMPTFKTLEEAQTYANANNINAANTGVKIPTLVQDTNKIQAPSAAEVLRDNYGNQLGKNITSGVASGVTGAYDYFKGLGNELEYKLKSQKAMTDALTSSMFGKSDKEITEELKTNLQNIKTEQQAEIEADRAKTQWARDYQQEVAEGNQNYKGLSKGLLNAANTTSRMLSTSPLGTYGIFANAAGGAYNQAMDAGADSQKALAYATTSGALETGVEMASGGAAQKLLNIPAVGKISNLTENITNPFLRGTANVVGDILGEGGEEVITALLDPYIQKATYNPNAGFATWSEAMADAGNAFVESILPTLLMGGTSYVVDGVNSFTNKQIEKIQSSNLPQNEKQQLINQVQQQGKQIIAEQQKNIAPESAQMQETTAANEVIPQEGVNANIANVARNTANVQNVAKNEVENLEKTTYNEAGGVEDGRRFGNQKNILEVKKWLAETADRQRTNAEELQKKIQGKIVTTPKSDIVTQYEKNYNIKINNFDDNEMPSFASKDGIFISSRDAKAYGEEAVIRHEVVENAILNGTDEALESFSKIITDIRNNKKAIDTLYEGYKNMLTNADKKKIAAKLEVFAKEVLCDINTAELNNKDSKFLKDLYRKALGEDFYNNAVNIINNNLNKIESKSSEQQGSFLMPTAEELNQPSQEMIEGAQALTLEERGWKPSEGEADILDDTQKTKTNVKELAKDTVRTFKRMFVDSGTDIAEIGKITGDSSLYHKFNSAKQAGQSANYMISDAQTNWQGDKVGKSLIEIFEPIRSKGKDYYKQFQYYMYHLHNINRMEQGKPVFGDNITADESRRIAEKLSKEYPEFNDYAEDIRKWNANLQQYRIDTGLISQEQADLMNEMYPNYVPTYRDVNGISGATKNGNTVKIVNTIKKATGSDKNILPLHEQMARQVMQTVQAGRRNVLGMQLYNDVIKNTDKLGKYVQEIKTAKEEAETDSDFEFEKQDLEGKFIVFNNGQQIQMQVSKGVLDGLKSLTSNTGENNRLSKIMTWANGTFKKLVTEWNPGFIVKNAARDIQDAGFYSENAKEFYKNYPEAWKEITKNGELWQKYLAMGGSASSLFDFEQGYNIPKNGLGNKVVDAIGNANFCVEQAPRFAEFLRLYKESDESYDALMDAMYGAADITVNFGRSGTWGKFINNNLVPFFNPAIQGTDKTIRTLLGTDSKIAKENYAKHIANIVGKGLALGVAPTMINHILLEVFGGDDYDDISERDKDLYFLIPVGEGKYIKIPKGRVLSVMGGAARRGYEVATGNKDAFEGFGKFMLEQTAPMNPFTNNIASPLINAGFNTTWYGTPIENESMQNLRPEQRYDEGTTELAKGLGKAFNISPKKIDYVMDAYGGVLADTAMPLMTKKAETSGFGKSFILDSTYSNRLSTDFYDTIQELTYDKNDDDPIANMQLKYMNDAKSRAQDINKEIKDVQASNIEDKEKLNKVRELRKEVNAIQRDALNTYEKYGETANKYIENEEFEKFVAQGFTEKTTEESKKKAIDKMTKVFTDRDVLGAEYALAEYDSDVANKQQKVEEYGIDAETFFRAYFAQKYVKGTPGPNGKTISDSESRKKKEAIDKATENLSKYQRRALYKEFGVGESVW